MHKRVIAFAVTAAIAASTISVATATAQTPSGNQGSTTLAATTPATVIGTGTAAAARTNVSTSTPPAVPAKPKVVYKKLPNLPKGMSKATVDRLMKQQGFRVEYRYTYGKKNAVQKVTIPNYYRKAPGRKWDAKRKQFLYAKHAKFIVTLGNGKSKPKPWKTGVATWYSIADNTPRGSRQTSSGHPLGSFGGRTFASRNFPMGTKLLIKHRGKSAVVTMTDRGGLHTIDLYKPTSDYLGMGGKSTFKYQVLRRGW